MRLAVTGLLVFAALGTGPVFAEGVLCDDPGVRVQGQISELWAGPIGAACEAVLTLKDRDLDARVKLVAASTDILVVEVALKDGRTAVRHLKDPEALQPTLEALLTLPPLPASDGPAPSAAPAAGGNDLPMSGDYGVSFEAGAAVSGRAAGSSTYLSLAPMVFAELRLGPWIVGIDARWELLEWRPQGREPRVEMDTIGLGINVARRFDLGFMQLDTGFAPRLVLEIQSLPGGGDELTGTAFDLRLGALVRGVFAAGSIRPFVALDVELSPTRMRRSRRALDGFPVLPAFSAGLGVGLMWGPG